MPKGVRFERRGPPPGGVRIDPSGRLAVVLSLGRIEFWNLRSRDLDNVVQIEGCHSSGVWAIGPTAAELWLGCRENGLNLFDSEGNRLTRFTFPSDAETYLKSEASGLGSFGSVSNPDGTRRDLSRVFGAYTTPSSIAVAATGDLVLVAYGQTFAALWETSTGKLRHLLGREAADGDSGRIYAVALSHDGGLAATRDDRGSLRIWSTRERAELLRLGVAARDQTADSVDSDDKPAAQVGAGGVVGAISFTPDASAIAVGESTEMRLYSLPGGREFVRWSGHESRHPIMGDYDGLPRIVDVRFSAAGHRAMTVGVDSTVRVWDVRSGVEIWNARPDPCCIDWADISPDGKTCVWVGCPGMRAYDLPD